MLLLQTRMACEDGDEDGPRALRLGCMWETARVNLILTLIRFSQRLLRR